MSHKALVKMNTLPPDRTVAQALAVARMRAWRVALIDLHKQLIDDERRRYEQANGLIGSPHHALQLLMHDPWFAWLRPLADLIVRLDERLDARPHLDRGLSPVELDETAHEIRRLLQGFDRPAFAVSYRQALQEVPDVVIAHGRVLGVLESFGMRADVRPTGADRRPGDAPS